jgi:hypothetical protein
LPRRINELRVHGSALIRGTWQYLAHSLCTKLCQQSFPYWLLHKILSVVNCRSRFRLLDNANVVIKSARIVCRFFDVYQKSIKKITSLTLPQPLVIFLNSKRSREQLPLSCYLEKIAQLGGYLARSSDSPPGNTVMWRGMRRLADMQLGFNLASERYG